MMLEKHYSKLTATMAAEQLARVIVLNDTISVKNYCSLEAVFHTAISNIELKVTL